MRKAKKSKGRGPTPRRGIVGRQGSGFAPLVPTPVALGLREAERLVSHGRPEAALDCLEALNREYPGYDVVLDMLLEGALALEDPQRSLMALEDIQRLHPDDSRLIMALPAVYLMNGLPALTLLSLRRLEDALSDEGRFSSEMRTQARGMLQGNADLQKELDTELAEAGLDDDDGFELAWRIELQNLRLLQGRFDDVRALADEMPELRPEFAPPLNNLSQLAWLEGDMEQAIAYCRRVLAFAPDNVHGLSNLARFLLLTGDTAGAKEAAEALKESKAFATDREVKVAEALIYLGDDAGVLDVFKKAIPGGLTRAEREGTRLGTGAELEEGSEEELLEDPQLYHLAAAAALRLGRENVARGLWRRAYLIDPDHPEVEKNLDDLEEPVGNRDTPWPFALHYWIPSVVAHVFAEEAPAALQAVKRSPGTPEPDGGESPEAAFLATILARFPWLPSLIPILLDKGDRIGREFALRLAMELETPESAAALRDYALGTRGTEQSRIEAGEAAVRAGSIEPGASRLFLEGAWQEVLLYPVEISTEPAEDSRHSPEVHSLLQEGADALNEGDGERAERLLRQAVEIEPDAPDLWNNLAAALMRQRRTEEAEEIIRRVAQQHPDYFFARTNLAMAEIQDGRLEKARELLAPLLKKYHLHVSEFIAIVTAEVSLAITEKNPNRANSWLEMFDDSDLEETDIIAQLRKRVQMLDLLKTAEALADFQPRKRRQKSEDKTLYEPD